MARRLLSDEQMAPFWAWASDEREIVRHYTLAPPTRAGRQAPGRSQSARLRRPAVRYALSGPRPRRSRDTAGRGAEAEISAEVAARTARVLLIPVHHRNRRQRRAGPGG